MTTPAARCALHQSGPPDRPSDSASPKPTDCPRITASGHYLYDGIGSPTALSTSASTTSYNLRFDPYGAGTRIDSAGTGGGVTDNPYLYQGGIQDRATGNLKFRGRWYNPATGGWTQQDTRNTPLDPSNANRYAYASDNPLNYNDPTGANIFGTAWNDFTTGVSALDTFTDPDTYYGDGGDVKECENWGGSALLLGALTLDPVIAGAGFVLGCGAGVDSYNGT